MLFRWGCFHSVRLKDPRGRALLNRGIVIALRVALMGRFRPMTRGTRQEEAIDGGARGENDVLSLRILARIIRILKT